MSRSKPEIGVLASGSGSTFEAVYHAIEKKKLPYKIGFVACNNGPEKAGVWERAQRLGVPIFHVSNKTQKFENYPEVNGQPVSGTISYEASQALLDLADNKGVHMLVGLGYMKRIIGKVLEGIPISNSHPGPLPATAGEHGEGVQRRALQLGLEKSGPSFHWMDKRVDENGMPQYDSGPIIGHMPVDITRAHRDEFADTNGVDLLMNEVMDIEKECVPIWIVRALDQIG